MKRFFLDSNVYDEFLKNQDLLNLVLDAQSRGLIELVGTHVEPDELQAAKQNNQIKGIRLVSAHLELNPSQVVTEGSVFGKSRYGEATLFSKAEGESFTKLTADNPNHSEDVLMILTAKRENATFVSEETRRVPRICKEVGIECINSQALGEWCRQNFKR